MPDEQFQTRIPGKTVYFLGAGFSAAAGIPTMSRFVPESFRLLKRYGPPALRDGLTRIMLNYRPIAATTEIRIDDIQELFSLVSGQHPKQPQQPNTDDIECLRAVIAHTLCYAELEDRRRMEKMKDPNATSVLPHYDCIDHWDLRDNRSSDVTRPSRTVPLRHVFPPNSNLHVQTVESQMQQRQPVDGMLNCCVYEAFLSYVLFRSVLINNNREYQDAIVTPNYDLVLERAAEKMPNICTIDYGKSVEPEPTGPGSGPRLSLVKLHGSLNWLPSEDPNEARWRISDPSSKVSAWGQDLDNDCIATEFGMIPLIPPTWQNDGVNGDSRSGKNFATLRGDALDHLRSAERIVIVGYSMPKTDLHIRYLMAHVLNTPDRPVIEVWDIKPKAEMQEAIETMFGKSLASEIRYEPRDSSRPEPYGLNSYVRSHSRH